MVWNLKVCMILSQKLTTNLYIKNVGCWQSSFKAEGSLSSIDDAFVATGEIYGTSMWAPS